MHRNRSVNVHQFAMVPRADIPRSSFRIEHTHKTTFDSGTLVPVYVDEVLPGDSFNLRATFFARLATPIVPIMDNLVLTSFFFFVPCRLVWANWEKFMGSQDNPGDSISFTIPQIVSPANGFAANSIYDYMGLPCTGQITAGNTVSVNSLPLRAYNLIWTDWFRDENLQNSAIKGVTNIGDGPDNNADFVLQRRGKRHDYFTSALPWVQKGNTSVSIPLGTSATVKSSSTALLSGAQPAYQILNAAGAAPGNFNLKSSSGNTFALSTTAGGADGSNIYFSNLYADLSTATAATINQLRQSFQIQRLLERDARGGTRYTEVIRSHFGVISPDARLQRPEYLGGGSTPISINPIAQNTATGLTGGSTPLGTLAAFGTLVGHNHGFTQSFTEHGYVIGLISVDADLTYQQGIRKMWRRNTRYDFYFPVFAHLGEQPIYNYEIYTKGDQDANDALVFGYQERWAEYRYHPSLVTGLFNSTNAAPLDVWHLAQKFTALPTLNGTFIQSAPPLSRILATASTGKELLLDAFFSAKVARPMPMYSVPGLIDHF